MQSGKIILKKTDLPFLSQKQGATGEYRELWYNRKQYNAIHEWNAGFQEKGFVLVSMILILLLTVPCEAQKDAPTEEGATLITNGMNWRQELLNASVADDFDGYIATMTLKDGLEVEFLIPDGFAQWELSEEGAAMAIDLAPINDETDTSIQF